ncbi:J domain-containing protein [Bacteroidales bacterium AH-315-I05]|nr:J domain-containing protein [Bacteroidales bacterium AH-315-I05]
MNHYDTLKIPKTANRQEIKSAYRKLAMQYHPDKNQDDRVAEEKFKELAEANSVLSDPEKRKAYDEKQAFSYRHYASYNQRPAAHPPSSFSKKEKSALGFITVFGNIFNFFSNTDIEIELDLTLEEMAFGCMKKVSYERTVPCVQCEGHLFVGSCTLCHNEGVESSLYGAYIRIPQGTMPGIGIRLRNAGHLHPFRNPGHLLVMPRQVAHPLFTRKGNDLYTSFDLKKNTRTIKVKGLAGETITIKAPHKAQNGQLLRIKGKGIDPEDGKKGDLLVRLVFN